MVAPRSFLSIICARRVSKGIPYSFADYIVGR